MVITRGRHLLGKELGGCVLEKVLGYGGSSAVFLARQQSPERAVAVKVFLPRSNDQPQLQKDFRRRFRREAEAASTLDHPHILPIYSFGEEEGAPYIIMPYMSGGTLSEYVSRKGPLSLEEANTYLEQISSALDYAHEHGRVHCDVKPANILLDGEGKVFLSDFGIARILQTADPNIKNRITHSSDVLMGTPDYISPEQALGQALDGRSDVYSLAVTLFFLLAGHPPFNADSSIAMALLHVHESPPSLMLIRDDVSPEMDEVVAKALAKAPADRYQVAGAFAKAFSTSLTSLDEWQKLSQDVQERSRPQVAASPIVHVKPVHSRNVRVQPSRVRLLVLALLACLLIGGVSLGLHALFAPPAPLHTPDRTHQASTTDQVTDALSAENHAFWPLSSTFFFQNNQYHIQNKSSSDMAVALFNEHEYQDFKLDVNLNELHGPHDGSGYYGIVFHSTADQSHYYLFELSSVEGGRYDLLRNDGTWQRISTGLVKGLHPIQGQENHLSAEVRGNSFTFFLNGQKICGPVSDASSSPYRSGQTGLYVESGNTEVMFSQLQIEPLPAQK